MAAPKPPKTVRAPPKNSVQEDASDTEVSAHDNHHPNHPQRHSNPMLNGRMTRHGSLTGGGGGSKYDSGVMNYGIRSNSTESQGRQDPVATDWTAPVNPSSEVSADPCCDLLVRYEPREEYRKDTKKVLVKKVSQVYTNWNMHNDTVLRPPIVFNGTFPIDKPISSRFVDGIPETIDEEEDESSGTEGSSSSSTSSSDSTEEGDVGINKRISGMGVRRGFRGRSLRTNRRALENNFSNNKVHLRRRVRISRGGEMD